MANLKRSTSALLGIAPMAFALGALSFASPQDSSSSEHAQHQEKASAGQAEPTLHSQIAELRAKVTRLEAALELNHEAAGSESMSMPNATGAAKGMGMGKMMGKGKMKMKGMAAAGGGMGMSGMGKKGGDKMAASKPGMGMGGMKRMRMMGSMGNDTAAQPVAQPSFLPGFPGASHIYHIGATSHFLDHSEHINPTPEQRKLLAQMLEKSALAQSGFERRIAQAEQDLWVLTSVGEPDAAKIESKVKEAAQLQVEQRLAFIRSVGGAAGVLSEAQRAALVGDLGAKFDESETKQDAAQDR